MNKFFRSAALLLLGFFPLITLAGTGDFSPNRSGYTKDSHSGGSSKIEFNRYTDSIPFAYYAGDCPDPVQICQRAYGKNSCTLREFRAGLNQTEKNQCFNSNVSDERDFLKAGHLIGGSGHPYSDNLASKKTLKAGDKVRMMVYVHNNGPEGKSAFTAKNTSVTLNWSNKQKVKASIFASNAVPNTITDTSTLAFTNNDLIFKPTGGAFFINHKTGNQVHSISATNVTSTSQTYNFGNFYSSYGNFHILFVDFVVTNGTRNATITKSSVPVTTTLVERNSNIVYTLNIKNTGNLPLTNTIVRDPLDTNLTFVSAPSTNDYTASHNNGLVQFNLKRLFQPGESIALTFTAKVKQTTPAGSIIRNKGTLSADKIPDKISNETEHPVAETVKIISDKTGWNTGFTQQITKIKVGESYGYQISVTNQNNQDLTGDFVIEDRLPAEVQFVNFATHVSNSGTNYNVVDTIVDARNYKFEFKNLKANDTIKLRFIAKAKTIPTNGQTVGTICPDKTKYNNRATVMVFKSNSDQNNTQNRIYNKELCHPLTPEEPTPPNLTSVKKAFNTQFSEEITTISIGDSYGYEVAVTNQNNEDLIGDFVVEDRLPAEVQFVNFATHVSNSGTNYNVVDTIVDARNYKFEFKNLKANDTIKLRFIAKAKTIPTNGQTVGTICPDKTKYNNRATVMVFKSNSDQNNTQNRIYNKELCHPLTPEEGVIKINKEVFLDYNDTPISGQLSLGDEVIYKITVVNTSPNNILDVITWQDELPQEVSYVDQSPNNNPQIAVAIADDFQNGISRTILSATFGQGGEINLAGNESRVFRFKVKLTTFPEDAVTMSDLVKCVGTTNGIVNEVTLNRDFKIEDKDCVVIVVGSIIRSDKLGYELDFTTPKSIINVGEEVGYEITLQNLRNLDITGDFQITDILPDEMEFVRFVDPVSDKGTTTGVQSANTGDNKQASFTFTKLGAKDIVRLRFIAKAISVPTNGQTIINADGTFSTCPNPAKYNNKAAVLVKDNTSTPGGNPGQVSYQADLCHILTPNPGGGTGTFAAEKEAFNEAFTAKIETINLNENFGYEIAVTNNSNIDINDDFRIIDTLPSEVEFVRIVPTTTSDLGNNYSATGSSLGNEKLVFTHNGLNAGDTIRHRVIVKAKTIPTTGQTFTNVQGTPANCPDPTKYNNGATVQLFKNGTRPGSNLPGNPSDKIGNDIDLCEPVTPQTPGGNTGISAEKEAWNTAFTSKINSIKISENFAYEISVVNTGSTNISNDFVVTDILPAELDFVRFLPHVSDGGNTLNITDTKVDARNLRFNFSELKANDTIRLRFEVKARVIPTAGQTFTNVQGSPSACPTPTIYNNGATVQQFKLGTGTTGGANNKIGNDIDLCEPVSIDTETVCTENCGGGNTPTTPSRGRCQNVGGSYSCTRVTPNLALPGFTQYKECLNQTNKDKEICVDEWIGNFAPEIDNILNVSAGKSCDPSQTSQNIEALCKPDVLIPGTPSCSVNPSASITKTVKTQSGLYGEKACVPQGDIVTYKVDVRVPAISGDVTSAEMTLNDFTIPFSSGWEWYRAGAKVARVSVNGVPAINVTKKDAVDSSGNKTGGIQFIYNFGGGKYDLLQSGATVTYEYDINTSLAASSDICQIDNIAYATIKYSVRNPLDGSINNQTIGVGKNSCAPLLPDDVGPAIQNGTISTYGDKARLCIARPFIKARGGSNVGVTFSSDKSKVFGSNFVQELGSVTPTIPSVIDIVNETVTSGELLTNNSSNQAYQGGSLVNFDGLEDYIDGNTDDYKGQLFLNARNDSIFGKTAQKSQVSEAYKINGDLVIGSSNYPTSKGQTVFVEGDLMINNDFIIGGSGFVAFIVKGDINVKSNVKRMDGIFFTQNGKINGEENRDDQLQINGGIMGDAEGLLTNRLYIGSNPTVKLEPAVLVRYDLRLLNDTPPGIEFFLGQSWKEGLQ